MYGFYDIFLPLGEFKLDGYMFSKKNSVIRQFESLKTKLNTCTTLQEFYVLIQSTIDLSNIYVSNLQYVIQGLQELPEINLGVVKTGYAAKDEGLYLRPKKKKADQYLDQIISHLRNNDITKSEKKSFWNKFDVKLLLGLLIPTFTLWMITLFAYFNAVNTGYSTEYTKGKNSGKDENQIQINILTKEIGVLQDSILFLNKKIKEKSPK